MEKKTPKNNRRPTKETDCYPPPTHLFQCFIFFLFLSEVEKMWWGLKKSDISLVFFFFFLFYNESMKRSGRSKGHVPLHRSPCFLFFSFFSFSPLYFSFYSTFIYFQVKEGGGSLVIYQNYQGLPNSTIFFSNFHRSRRFYLTSSITLFTLEPESTKAICFHSIHFFNFPQQRT